MWIFTQDGFVSAVDNGQVPGKLAVRARDKEALELLSISTGADIQEFRGTDYEYRVHVTREDFTKWLTMPGFAPCSTTADGPLFYPQRSSILRISWCRTYNVRSCGVVVCMS